MKVTDSSRIAVPVILVSAVAVGVCAFPIAARACEPVPALMLVLAGPSWFAMSAIWLPVAVATKCVVFAILERRRLSILKAVGLLAAGNVVSTSIGLVVAFCAAVPPLFVIAFLLIYFVSVPAARNLADVLWKQPNRAGLLAAAAPILLVVTYFLLMCARDVLRQDALWIGWKTAAAYWLLKLGYVTVSLFISIGLSALWEERVVASLAGGTGGSYLVPVVRANYVTFILLTAVAAALTIPARLHTHGFLTVLATALGR